MKVVLQLRSSPANSIILTPTCIPGVAYTDPEIAWAGVTETQAKAQGLDYGKGVFLGQPVVVH